MVASMLASVLALAPSGGAGAAERAERVRFGAICVHNEGQVARQFDVNIFKTLPRHKERLVESASVRIGAGGDFRWNRALLGKVYRVEVTSQPSGVLAFDETRQVPRDDSGGLVSVLIPLDPDAGDEDPRDAQIDLLEQQLAAAAADCDAQLGTLRDQYDAMIATMQAHIDTLEEQNDSLMLQLAQFAPPLTAVRDPGFGGATATAGTTHVQIASYGLTVSDAQDVQITRLTFDKDKDNGLDLRNLTVEVDGVQFGTVRGGVGDEVKTMDFNGSHIVPASGSIVIAVYADVQANSTAGTHLTSIDLIGWVANGVVSGTAVPFSGIVLGQDVVVTVP